MRRPVEIKDKNKYDLTHSPPEDIAVILTVWCQISYIRHTLVGNKIVDHSDVVGVSPACHTLH